MRSVTGVDSVFLWVGTLGSDLGVDFRFDFKFDSVFLWVGALGSTLGSNLCVDLGVDFGF